jgi:hypothetical protein
MMGQGRGLWSVLAVCGSGTWSRLVGPAKARPATGLTEKPKRFPRETASESEDMNER